MILVACKHCSRAFVYGDRTEADKLCPDCDRGPFDKWFITVSTSDDLMADGGQPPSEIDRETRDEILAIIDDVESTILDEDKSFATRGMIAEGTCERIRERIHSLATKPYRETALERGRPTGPCECEDCECPLHTFSDDTCCIWCRNGDHRDVAVLDQERDGDV